ncbi:Dihydrolipoyl dehydrogenase [Planctomycetes bacterium Pla163]|uniref:Dihydrolipoyl dehydrogenase n=1 Tax=Rohdeia mirabilis TaxID=2528008 RepID=A0A518CY88_9BACT|nr:Dihydrolipoyl dehydrogenase [Planctomycetes bacterium Pla163]
MEGSDENGTRADASQVDDPNGGATTWDLVVIGGGSAGSACAAEAIKLGHERVLLLNDGELGGLCILEGCMPTKTLLHPADVVREVGHAERLGIDAQVNGVDMAALQERRARLVARFQRAKIGGMESGGYTIEFGRARFVGPDEVEVTGPDGATRRVRSRAWLVSTGSKQHVPDTQGLGTPQPDGSDPVPYWTSREALLADRVPRSLAIVGSGAIGLEFGVYFAALGTRVTLLSRSPILRRGEDPELSALYTRSLEHAGLKVQIGAALASVTHDPERGDEPFEIEYWEEGHDERFRAERLLLATGRVANLDGIGLEAAGVEIANGMPVLDDCLRSTNPNVFFAGDATGDRLILHTGNAEGRHVARNLKRHFAGEKLVAWRERIPVSALFTAPPYAECGRTEHEARQAGVDVVSAKKEWANQGRGIVMDTEPGTSFVKLVVERPSARLVGCQILGPRADDLVHVISTAMHMGATARDLVAMPWYHPTLSEAFIELARDVVFQCDPIPEPVPVPDPTDP